MLSFTNIMPLPNQITSNLAKFFETYTIPYFSLPELAFIVFFSLVCLIAIFIIFSKDVIYCLLGIILLYILVAVLLLKYNLEFLCYSLIIVSLGAVAVLFLYVVLMVNLKGFRVKDSMFYNMNISFFIIMLIFLSGILWIISNDIAIINMIESSDDGDEYAFLQTFEGRMPDFVSYVTNLKLYGFILYDKFFIFFILIGVLLLAALIGCILLTHDFMDKKNK
jgi:NADH-quinone oxidoreductase subunit J